MSGIMSGNMSEKCPECPVMSGKVSGMSDHGSRSSLENEIRLLTIRIRTRAVVDQKLRASLLSETLDAMVGN
jgi:hypothetical protein